MSSSSQSLDNRRAAAPAECLPPRGASRSERIIRDLAARADVMIGGTEPWDITVNRTSFYEDVLADPALRFGESYMDGDWDCPRLDMLFARLEAAGAKQIAERNWRRHARIASARLLNWQTLRRAEQVARTHYDAGNDLFERMLDPSMTYTCALWQPGIETLEQAQEAKLRLVCEKLELKPGQCLLDIGCGWGGLAAYAARHYGVSVVGIANSVNQLAFARQHYGNQPNLEFVHMDYRELLTRGSRLHDARFDAIASVEMIEAVGPRNLTAYMRAAHHVLRPNGRFLIQTIASHTTSYVGNAWTHKYIFPNGVLVSLAQIARAAESTFGAPIDVHNLGRYYDQTLLAWNENLQARWTELAPNYGERFRRMMTFYLLSFAGRIRAGGLPTYQILFGRGDIHALVPPRTVNLSALESRQ